MLVCKAFEFPLNLNDSLAGRIFLFADFPLSPLETYCATSFWSAVSAEKLAGNPTVLPCMLFVAFPLFGFDFFCLYFLSI